MLSVASLVGSGLGFLDKAACRAGAWNTAVGEFQAHCYTDIYPLYYAEGLSDGKIPYVGHHVEYPVLIGAAMQAVAWLVRALAGRGCGLAAGQVVIAGALTEAVPVAPGDTVVAHFDRLGTVELACR